MGKAAAQSRTKARQQQKKAAAQRQTFTYLAGGIVVIALLAMVYLISGGGSAVTGQDFSASTLDGQPVQLSDYRGQVVMLNFWATWCPPCRAEMPAMQAALDRYADQGLVVLAVNQREDPAVVAAFMRERQLTFPALLDANGSVGAAYQASALPSSFFIGRDGMVRAVYRGPLSRGVLESTIAGLVAEP